MALRVCPPWIGRLMVSPIRRLMLDPRKMLAPYLRSGMTVLEPGPGMGFFTLAAAEMVGPGGCVVAVDVQTKMLEGLRRRAVKAGLSERIEIRLAEPEAMGVDDLRGKVDLVLAIAVVHELPSVDVFFREAAITLKSRGTLLLVEPAGHVKEEDWKRELAAARAAGLETIDAPQFRRSRAALMRKAA